MFISITHQKWVGEIGQIRHQDAHKRTDHNEHCAHPQHNHWPICYELSIAAKRFADIQLLKVLKTKQDP